MRLIPTPIKNKNLKLRNQTLVIPRMSPKERTLMKTKHLPVTASTQNVSNFTAGASTAKSSATKTADVKIARTKKLLNLRSTTNYRV